MELCSHEPRNTWSHRWKKQRILLEGLQREHAPADILISCDPRNSDKDGTLTIGSYHRFLMKSPKMTLRELKKTQFQRTG